MGLCFFGKESSNDWVMDAFMTQSLDIMDEDFRKECSEEIANLLRQQMKAKRDKIASTYRKNLTNCKCNV